MTAMVDRKCSHHSMIQHSLIADHHILYIHGARVGVRRKGGERKKEKWGALYLPSDQTELGHEPMAFSFDAS